MEYKLVEINHMKLATIFIRRTNLTLGLLIFNHIQDVRGGGGGGGGGGGAKSASPHFPSISLSSVTSENVRISLQRFLTFLPRWCKISTWTKTTPPKKQFFWSNLYKIKVTITSLVEMLELPKFGHMKTFTL